MVLHHNYITIPASNKCQIYVIYTYLTHVYLKQVHNFNIITTYGDDIFEKK